MHSGGIAVKDLNKEELGRLLNMAALNRYSFSISNKSFSKDAQVLFGNVFSQDLKTLKKQFLQKMGKSSSGLHRHRYVDESNQTLLVNNIFLFREIAPNTVEVHGLLLPQMKSSDLVDRYLYLSNQLKEERQEVEDLSNALRKVMRTVESEKQSLKDNIATYIESSIVPILIDLRKASAQKKKFDIVLNNLKSLLDSQNRKLFLVQNRLTPKEIEICYQLVQGQKGKDIAENMDISYLTMRTHTKNIRKKLSLGRNQNLSLYLQEYLSGNNLF
jgi:DNA-binding CsgD family transcriptional regulator